LVNRERFVAGRYTTIAVRAGGRERQRSVRRDVDRHRLRDVEEPHVLVQEADRPRHAIQRVLHLFAMQQRTHDAQVFGEYLRLHRVHPHHAHGGVACAYTEENAAWCDLVDGRDRMRGDRRSARTDDRDTGAEPHLARVCGH
jgi:hypothetical protein